MLEIWQISCADMTIVPQKKLNRMQVSIETNLHGRFCTKTNGSNVVLSKMHSINALNYYLDKILPKLSWRQLWITHTRDCQIYKSHRVNLKGMKGMYGNCRSSDFQRIIVQIILHSPVWIENCDKLVNLPSQTVKKYVLEMYQTSEIEERYMTRNSEVFLQVRGIWHVKWLIKLIWSSVAYFTRRMHEPLPHAKNAMSSQNNTLHRADIVQWILIWGIKIHNIVHIIISCWWGNIQQNQHFISAQSTHLVW